MTYLYSVDTFLDMLSKAQSSRFDDQRGARVTVGDLPDFLKSSSDQETDTGSVSSPAAQRKENQMGARLLHLSNDRWVPNMFLSFLLEYYFVCRLQHQAHPYAPHMEHQVIGFLSCRINIYMAIYHIIF